MAITGMIVNGCNNAGRVLLQLLVLLLLLLYA